MDDPFKLLEKNQVSISPHIVTILKSCGYISLQDLANFKSADILGLEDDVRNVLATEDYCSKLDEEAKLTTFGPVFCTKPAAFKFLSGERKQLQTISIKAGQLCSGNKKLVRSLSETVNRSSTGNLLNISCIFVSSFTILYDLIDIPYINNIHFLGMKKSTTVSSSSSSLYKSGNQHFLIYICITH